VKYSVISDLFTVPKQLEQDVTSRKPGHRYNFSSETSDVLKGWLRENMDHPYPSSDDLASIVVHTNLKPAQIKDWFINARRRILPQMKQEISGVGRTISKKRETRKKSKEEKAGKNETEKAVPEQYSKKSKKRATYRTKWKKTKKTEN